MRVHAGLANLVHLLELERDSVEARHKLVQSLLPQLIVLLLLLITEIRDLFEILSASQELLLAPLVVLEHVQVRLRILQFL